jgi:hypothetical protein
MIAFFTKTYKVEVLPGIVAQELQHALIDPQGGVTADADALFAPPWLDTYAEC